MLYISLILISAGVFFIIYTLLIKSKKDSRYPRVKKLSGQERTVFYKQPEKSAEKNIINSAAGQPESTAVNLNSEIDILRDIELNVLPEEPQTDLLTDIVAKENTETVKFAASDVEADKAETSNDYFAALFEDSSEIIDYDNDDSTIDLSFNEYKKIKRIGSGKLEILIDGISFRDGKRLFRFDFHQVANIKTGSNYTALILKKSKSSRLFLFNKNSNLGSALKQAYNNYSANVFNL